MRRAVGLIVGVAVLLLITALPAGATWSIVGVDPETGQVGVAVASCVPLDLLDRTGGFDLIALAPGKGAGISQALYIPAARDEIERLLIEGEDPDAILAAVTNTNFDGAPADRQHGVAAMDGSAAGYTGSENSLVALDRQETNVSVQGNILVSEDVVNDAIDAFVLDGNRSLAERLVAALEAGSTAGGDARCGDQTALFAHVSVIDRDGSRSAPNVVDLTASAKRGDGQNPVTELASMYRSSVQTEARASSSGGRLVIIGLAIGLAAAVAIVLRRQCAMKPNMPKR